MLLPWLAATAVLAALAIVVRHRVRQSRVARLRAAWGKPIERSRRMAAMEASHHARLAASPHTGSLDDRTWRDLLLDEVFTALDRTVSTLGQHALYHRLRTAPVGEQLGAFEALVERMSADAPARERAQLALERLQDPLGYDIWWLSKPDAVEQHAWYVVFPLLFATTLAAAALGPFWPLGFTPLVVLLVVNVTVRYATDPHVCTMVMTFRQCAPLVATAGELRFLTGAAIDPLVRPLADDVPRLRRLKQISRWVNGNPFMLTAGSDPLGVAVSDFVGAVYEYVNLALLLDGTGLYFGTRDLAGAGASLARAVAAAGEVDAAIAVASYRADRDDWCRPTFRSATGATELTDLRHPLVDRAVPNSLALQLGHGMLITGSNMSGKSTFLRTVGVNVVLAQTINTCLARDYGAPVVHVRSCIGRADDLMSGTSYYLAEVEALLELVRASGGAAPHLFLLDELFRGTNAVERIAAGQAVLTQLVDPAAAGGRHLVLAATHDLELVELAADRYAACHFADAIGEDGLTFSHQLQHGPSTSRNALALLRLRGAPDALVRRAMATAQLLDHHRNTTIH